MMKNALIFGSTGLVGSELVKKLTESAEYSRVYLVNRRESGVIGEKIVEIIFDYEQLVSNPEVLISKINEPIQVVFCTLGTTIKKAGSQHAFFRVDHDYVLATAQIAEKIGALTYIAVSAVGADPASSIFYSRVKGQTEKNIASLAFSAKAAVHFLRPSLLLGKRKEFRMGERAAIILSPVLNLFMVGSLRRYRSIEASQVALSMIRFADDSRPGVWIHENGVL
jgi:uncharacterized protein YbjT (DUF2867 family)